MNKSYCPALLTRSPCVFLCICSYLSFRLLGSALPLLSAAQLKEVLSGEVMVHYGEHVVSAQVRGSIQLDINVIEAI